MYNPLTWKDDNGEVQTKASKPALIKRLYLMERFYALHKACLWELEQYKEYALLVRSGKLPPEASDYIERQLPRYRQHCLQARQRLEALRKRIANGSMDLPVENELSPLQGRTVTPEQFSRLMTVLKDNGIDEDEADTVAEAACFVLDMEADIPSDAALCRIAHSTLGYSFEILTPSHTFRI
jgi:hypothetical protein